MPANDRRKVLWTGEGLKLSIGQSVLLDGASFSITAGERLALAGRNGCGKSTLLRVIAGTEKTAEGEIIIARDLRITLMEQDPFPRPGKTVREVVHEGVSFFESVLDQYEHLPLQSPGREKCAAFLNLHDAWDPERKLASVLEKLSPRKSFPDEIFSRLSGGERRKVLLAKAIAGDPDLLLLDEPTNHLDVDTIAWMERFLASFRGACLLVTHDRCFLDRVATRILELDHGKIYSVEGSYADFLEAKAAREYTEDLLEQKRIAFLRREIEWVRRSPKARLRRNLGREKRYYEIAAQSGPERTGSMELLIPPPSRLGNKVVALHHVSFSRGERTLLHDFSCEFTAGDKVGIVGPNGAGKSSLLKLITGELLPDSGSVEVAPSVIFNLIDQDRTVLDPGKTVQEEASGGKDFIAFGSERLTVWTYLKRFLFTDDRIRTRVEYLSGGEKARLALAKELKSGGNFLILDEPTNDLDLPSLRVLEEALAAYPSTILLVSHDRYFLNRVCNRILAFDKPGVPRMFLGDFDSYDARRKAEREAAERENIPPPAEKHRPADRQTDRSVKPARKKLSFREERELQSLEEEIPVLEEEIAALGEKFATPDVSFSDFASEMRKETERLEKLRTSLNEKYVRWETLAAKQEEFAKGGPAE